MEEQSASSSNASVDSSPLLGNFNDATAGSEAGGRFTGRRGRISRVFRLLRGRNGQRLMREPSVLVREAAAEQLEDRQTDFAYSRPVVILDLIWNLSFIIVAVAVLIMSMDERPSNPLRVWIAGYALQCAIHMTCVCVEYQHRRRGNQNQGNPRQSSNAGLFSSSERSQGNREVDQQGLEDPGFQQASIAKRIESANTSFSFVWWVLGFYWTTTGSQSQSAPLLFWLSIAFLAFDVFFVIFCVSLACIIGVAVCCCLPCIIAIMYAVAEQEGASEEDISILPKFKFRRTGSFAKVAGDLAGPSGGVMSMIVSSGPAIERTLLAEDAECCICLSSYDDGVDLRELPCGHHFHCACIDRWLRMNSTCPLCKYNICKTNSARDDV